ncbi:AtpZ/AtpI family protein [Pseudodesulfovibrio sediminis]|uniref:AtpZ/AtpI family protein n=1 Tax=Pseudodesulfovibrio sediminis TaxID=2810563 RepID=UPI001E31BE7D|nr:AtpZ/AtpI family protein [Pseudodesulfovibrio sediminis]
MLFSKGNNRFGNLTKLAGPASQIGMHLVSSIIVGLAIGYFLDDHFGTKPWFIMIFFLLGVVAGFKMVFQDFKKIQRQVKAQDASSLKQDGEESAGQD